MGLKECCFRVLPFAAMVMLESLSVGLTTLSKAAMSKGMNNYIFVLYSNAIATLFIFPTYFFFLRKKSPPVTFTLLCRFFILSLLGLTGMQNCVMTGINYSSPTLGSAMSQLIPAFTFILAVVFRMEKVDLKSSRSQIKILGTVLTIAGAMIVIFFKGPKIGGISSRQDPTPTNLVTENDSWVIGGLFLATGSLCLSMYAILQAAILKEYKSEMTVISFFCLFGTIQCGILCLITVRDPNAWKLNLDIELISVIYSAFFGTFVTYAVLSWCINKKGPVFVAMFKPVGIAVAALFGVIFLGDTLQLGSILGAIVIVGGFYGVIWAQSKDEEQNELKQSSSQKTPLLESRQSA
ncbi:hypothetical protein K2173_022842 [Erythroxylum novogranatense]|uniref:WAT1-related protein n=1 Tax=Erythroxylum novogranatense TaxID=1862640 RepID=A0AAV8SNK9_9ROSI|nr:hypothetical protein K2173_022842 [Erythroxylum novogranatense]